MKVTEFFVGFGPRLWSFRRGETEYGVKAIPAGGYVRIIGMTNMEEVDPADEPRTFRQGHPRQAPRHDPRRRHRQPDHRVRPVLRGHRRPGPRRRRPEHHRRAQVVAGQRRARGRAPDRRQDRRRQRQAGRQLGRRSSRSIERNGGTADRRSRSMRDGAAASTLTATPKIDRTARASSGVGPGTVVRDVGRARGGARVVQRRWARSSPASPTSSATVSRRRA